MREQDEELEKMQLDHARVRVSAIRCLIESQKLLRKSSPGWEAKMEEYQERFRKAEAELQRLEAL